MSEAPDRPGDPDEALKSTPRRLQLFRGAKFDLQSISRKINGLPAIRIDRNSGWENLFLGSASAPTAAIETFRRWLSGEMSPDEMIRYSGGGRFSNGAWLARRREVLLNAMPSIRGKNLACWCNLRDPCHGDVLLEIANGFTNQEYGRNTGISGTLYLTPLR